MEYEINPEWTLQQIEAYCGRHHSLRHSGACITVEVWMDGLDGSEPSPRHTTAAATLVALAIAGDAARRVKKIDDQVLAYYIVPMNVRETKFGIVLLYGWNLDDPSEWEPQ